MKICRRSVATVEAMESPPSCSTWSNLVSSEDSGFIVNSGSLSSGIEVEECPDGEGWEGDSLWGGASTSGWGTVRKGAPTPRLSSSHNSLSTPNRADDSSFITSAMSHDNMLADLDSSTHFLYTVPFDSDIYSLPVDSLPANGRRRGHRRHTTTLIDPFELPRSTTSRTSRRKTLHGCGNESISGRSQHREANNNEIIKRGAAEEPVHMTLQEVREFLQSLYSSSGEVESETGPTGGGRARDRRRGERGPENGRRRRRTGATTSEVDSTLVPGPVVGEPPEPCQRSRTRKDSANHSHGGSVKSSLALLVKTALCNMFRLGSSGGNGPKKRPAVTKEARTKARQALAARALPPLPPSSPVPTLSPLPVAHPPPSSSSASLDFAASIQKVKDCGWYWGPISGEAAEKILSTEPDGSFIVRDSSDRHYIFSLTFRLNGCVRHVRIEHDQGNFSFGSCTKFKSQTIVEFIETAVEHSRSGRYLFFLHRRPVLGPMRVQLLHPVSRFKHVQSLQHLARFAIVKSVRRDLLAQLPLPRRLLDYINCPHYFSEQLGEHPSPPSPAVT